MTDETQVDKESLTKSLHQAKSSQLYHNLIFSLKEISLNQQHAQDLKSLECDKLKTLSCIDKIIKDYGSRILPENEQSFYNKRTCALLYQHTIIKNRLELYRLENDRHNHSAIKFICDMKIKELEDKEKESIPFDEYSYLQDLDHLMHNLNISKWTK